MDDLSQRDLSDLADEDLTPEERGARQVQLEQWAEQLEVSLLESWF